MEKRLFLKCFCEVEDGEYFVWLKCLKVLWESEKSCSGFISEVIVMSDREDLECKICYDVLY